MKIVIFFIYNLFIFVWNPLDTVLVSILYIQELSYKNVLI